MGNKKIPRTNDNEDTMTQNLWDAAEADLRGKVIAITVLPQETRKTSNLNLHIKQM